MKNRMRRLSLVLAALLQVMPMVRLACSNPAVASSFAIIFRWVIGGTAAIGAFDAVSGATTVYYTTPTNYTGTAGFLFTNNVALTNNGGDSGAYFVLTNKSGFSAQLPKGVSTTNCLPAGLTARCFDLNNGGSPQPIYLSISGIPTSPVTNYWVHVLAGYTGQQPAQTNIFITILPAGGASPPNITNNPVGVTNVVGGGATFSVTAGGTAPVGYQWFFKSTNGVANGTNSTLVLSNLQLTNAGYYSVAITNTAGAVTSTPALLFVAERPGITNQPVGVTNLAGGAAALIVVAGGTPPLSYQWYLSPAAGMAGATTATLNFPDLRASQAGNYVVVITNVWGAVTSAPAILGVTNPPPPSVTTQYTTPGNIYRFTFIPVVGLTNTVLTNNVTDGGTWGVLTNIPPPASTTPITISDPMNGPTKFYRVMFTP